MKGVVYSIV